jgi:hypothetical protein
MPTGYARGLLCECGAHRSDGSRRWCAECRYSKAPWEINSVEAARRRHGGKSPTACSRGCAGDAAVVREIISLKGLACSTPSEGR